MGASAGQIEGAVFADPNVNHAEDQTDSFHYDAAGHLDSSTDAMTVSESYEYDGTGAKRSFTSKKGATWKYEYDAA